MKTIELKQTGYSFTLRFDPQNIPFPIISGPVLKKVTAHYSMDKDLYPVFTHAVITHEFISAN